MDSSVPNHDERLDIEDVKKAYKKYKSYVYFSKDNLSTRDKLVKFECDEDITVTLENFRAMLDGDDQAFERFLDEILNSIDCSFFPKEIEEQNSNVIVNYSSIQSYNISSFQAMIDMDIRGHLIGALWCLYIGIDIDKGLNYCYGNRIRKFLFSENTGDITYSPYLFEPYYQNYESWRDTAIDVARQHHSKGMDILILTMDIKRYYYSVDITQEWWKSLQEDYVKENKRFILRIHNAVFRIMEKYSQVYSRYCQEENTNRIILPISFLPSLVISNVYLEKFDNAINNELPLIYYGRYVDDIILVLKISPSSPISSWIAESNDNKSIKDKIISYYLVKDNRWDDRNTDNLHSVLSIDYSNEYSSYMIKNQFLPLGVNHKLEIKKEKVKVFYLDRRGTCALLDNFRKAIEKNRSVFNRLPEDEEIFQYNDYSQVYNLLDNKINKIRDIDEFCVDKYNLSKYLAKLKKYSTLLSIKTGEKFIEDLDKILDGRTLLLNFTQWECIITILLRTKSYNIMFDLLKKIQKYIMMIVFDKKNDSEISEKIRKTLARHLCSSILRNYSVFLDKGIIPENLMKEVNDLIAKCKESDTSIDYESTPMRYIMSRMVDREQCSIIDVLRILNDKNIEEKVNIYDLFVKDNKSKYIYYPYLISIQEIMFQKIEYYVSIGKLENLIFQTKEDSVTEIFKIYSIINYSVIYRSADLNRIIEIRNQERKNIKGAVEEVDIAYALLEDETINDDISKIKITIPALKVKVEVSNRLNYEEVKIDEYLNIAKIINMAYQQKTNLLVFPELSVPYKLLRIIANYCAKNNICIICGLKYIVCDDKCYNLTATILPFKYLNANNSLIVFHSKNYFSPEEESRIISNNKIPMTSNEIGMKNSELFYWRDFWFTTYCCYEITSIIDRSRYMSILDAIFAIEYNKDTNYFVNIIESLCRDMHCYCIQANTSEYGDSRIVQPTKTVIKDIVRMKGGEDVSILTGIIDINSLRKFQCLKYEEQKEKGGFKPTPPQFNNNITKMKQDKRIVEILNTCYENQ